MEATTPHSQTAGCFASAPPSHSRPPPPPRIGHKSSARAAMAYPPRPTSSPRGQTKDRRSPGSDRLARASAVPSSPGIRWCCFTEWAMKKWSRRSTPPRAKLVGATLIRRAIETRWGRATDRATPTIAGKRVYTLGAEGRLCCLELASGKKEWERSLARDYKLRDSFFGIGSSPLIEGDLLLANLGAPRGWHRGVPAGHRRGSVARHRP